MECKLGDIVDFKNGKKKPKTIGDIPIYGGNGILGYTDKYNSGNDNIIVGRVGAFCGCVYKCDDKCWVSDNAILGQVKENNDYLFVYYLMKTIDIHNLHVGSGQPLMTQEILNNIIVNIPCYNEQVKVGKFLNKLDQKIEVNNQINNTLYEILEKYYKKKNINNIQRNLCNMNKLVEETIGGDWGKEELIDNYNKEVLCIRGADIPKMDRGNKGKAPNRFILEKNLNKKRLTGDEIVIEISGGSPTQSTGRCIYITPILEQSFKLPLICTNFCRAIRLKDKKYLPTFYMNLKYLYNRNIMFLYENGTTGIKNLDLNSLLENEEINILSEDEIEKFNSLFYSVNSKMVKNSEENRNLEQLRDIVLPKLINGEIDLDKIEI